ncbi:SusC/RagA family TonB-linked outer membrane protein [Parabacteroides sp. FAFU027]|uniref:SusC/RagA family TonB-linked outer membrane protein n=1 Tax=Parabacteroides sp. FAFU027 TaxID=2922715 RepID=UPI001FAEE737|nr:SusC/RagA family TonB-linked outer membrane protein [Parabacteroides sp. FAFU027]
MRKLTLFFLCLIVNIALVSAQTKVSGLVISAEDGQPVIGASVVVKGTKVGTVTDLDGRFSLNVPFGTKTLVFRYVGFDSKEESVKASMRIVMQPSSQALSEVVVTALGIKRSEKSLGYAATTISNQQLTTTGDRSALNALQGKVAGVDISSASGSPGASTRVILRGYSSLRSNNQPLYVIDGVPVSNGVVNQTDINGGYDFGNRANDINPDDIESITVLKGGSGTAQYGSRAANGVIIITTKNGSKANNKAKIEVSSTTTFDTPLKLPLMQNEFGQGWYDVGGTATNLEENGSWGPRFDGKIRIWGHVVDNQQQIKPYVALPSNIKDFFDVGVTTNNSFSLSNGDKDKSYFISYANINNDGIMPSNADSYKRNNLSLRGSSTFLKNLTLSGSLNYVRKDTKFVPTGQEQSVLDAIWQSARDISLVDLKDYNNKFNNVDNYYTVYAQNPYYVLNEHGNKFMENRVYGNTALDAKILPWLTATFRIGEDASNSTLKTWRAITKSTRADYNKEVGRVGENSYYASEFNTDFLLKIEKKLQDKVSLNAILGHNFNQRDTRVQTAEVVGLDIPNYYNLSNSSSTPSVTATTTQRRLVGVYGSFDLGYKDWLFLNFSARNDWSSTLPVNNRSFFFPGGSLSVVFTELMGKSVQNILSYGKIRAGIAQTGNDADPYLINSVLVQTTHTDGYRSLEYPLAGSINGFSVSNRIGSDKLKPEISTDMEIGTELKFLDNRYGMDIALYNKTITDLIWQASIPASTGYTSMMMNLGKITNKGVEISVSVIPVKVKDLEWEVFANYTRNINKLVKLTEGLDQISLGGTSSINYMARPGYELGLFEGNVLETDPDGHTVVDAQGLPIFKSEKGYLGSSQSKYRIGGGTSIKFKGITLKTVFDFRKGGHLYSRTKEILYFTGNAPQTTYNDRQPFIIPNSVQLVDGKYVENTTPIAGWDHNLNLYYNQTYNAGIGGAYALVDRTFLKMRELSLSYAIPKSVLASSFINSAEIALVGRNLFIWTPKSNIFTDPEQTTFGNDIEAGFGDYGATPSTKSLGFSVKLGF